METNKEALSECLELSRNLCKMGLGINSKRAACEIYSRLVEASANLGALITAADYVPMRSQRSEASVEAMKEISKVIYLLNVAKETDFFVKEAVRDTIKSAVKVSEHLNEIAAAYLDTGSVAVAPVVAEVPAAASAEDYAVAEGEAVTSAAVDQDGFNEPYNG